MATPERKSGIPEVSELMSRIRYRSEETGKRKNLPWYQTTPVKELEDVEPEKLTELQRQLLQQKEDIVSGALAITCPTAYTDGTLSHVHKIPREYFMIPGVLSLGEDQVTDIRSATVEPAPEHRTTTGARLADLLGIRRHEDH
jgi:hypothetical protein